jgi:hypothetical protein
MDPTTLITMAKAIRPASEGQGVSVKFEVVFVNKFDVMFVQKFKFDVVLVQMVGASVAAARAEFGEAVLFSGDMIFNLASWFCSLRALTVNSHTQTRQTNFLHFLLHCLCDGAAELNRDIQTD